MTTHDLIIRKGVVIDGSGSPRIEADLAVDGSKIVAIGDLSNAQGRAEIDAEGMIDYRIYASAMVWHGDD